MPGHGDVTVPDEGNMLGKGLVHLAIIQKYSPNEKYNADGNDCKSPKQSLSGGLKVFLILVLA